ncbi:MAG: alpha/beta hydrolase [SAR202 cluster bacterium]|nr:alpha/beta hydrolase [SAR202 cluster bacterium]MDP6713290.1 alpha/beta hydrolase [SAR202 cluster bacterium]
MDWGADERKPFVMLHGIHGHAREWDRLAEATRATHRPVAPEMRGHGDSARNASGEYSILKYVEDVGAFISELDLGPVSLMGHSLGGIIGIALAAMVPDAVERLIIVDIGPDLGEEGMNSIRESAGSRPRVFADLDSAYQWALEGDSLADESEMRHRIQHGLKPGPDGLEWRYDPGVDTILDSADGDGSSMLWGLWSSIAQPTLIIRGDQSDLLTSESAQQMAAIGQNASLVEVPNSGHLVPVDNPEFFCETVRGFLS